MIPTENRGCIEIMDGVGEEVHAFVPMLYICIHTHTHTHTDTHIDTHTHTVCLGV